MGMNINQLEFDPADTADSSNVGSYTRAGTDGDLIESTIINSKESLNVAAAMFSGDGTAITQTGGALDVNATFASPDTATANNTISVDTTVGGVAIPTTALTDRRYIFVQNLSNSQEVYLGFGTVSTANGIKLAKKSSFGPIDLGPSLSLMGITSASTADVRYLEVA